MEWIARAIGAFYVFAGVTLIRQAIINWRMERIFGTFLETPPAEKTADAILSVMAVLVLASGLTLAALHHWAVVAFLACWSVQAVYLLWASRWHRPVEPELIRLRRQTTNAFFAYTAATLFVLWAARRGLLS
jgi:hypothetical protein